MGFFEDLNNVGNAISNPMSWNITSPQQSMQNMPTAGQLPGMISSGFQGIGNNITGKGSQPTYTMPQMDAGSQAQLTNRFNGSQGLLATNPESNTNQIMQGTGGANNIQGQAGNQAAENQEQGGGGINGMSQAIGNKAQKNFAVQQGKLQQHAAIQGQEVANQNMSQAQAMGVALSDAQNHVNTDLNKLQLQYNQAQYQTVASIMSGAGTLAGGYFGSQKNTPPPTNEQLGAYNSYTTNPYSSSQNGSTSTDTYNSSITPDSTWDQYNGQ